MHQKLSEVQIGKDSFGLSSDFNPQIHISIPIPNPNPNFDPNPNPSNPNSQHASSPISTPHKRPIMISNPNPNPNHPHHPIEFHSNPNSSNHNLSPSPNPKIVAGVRHLLRRLHLRLRILLLLSFPSLYLFMSNSNTNSYLFNFLTALSLSSALLVVLFLSLNIIPFRSLRVLLSRSYRRYNKKPVIWSIGSAEKQKSDKRPDSGSWVQVYNNGDVYEGVENLRLHKHWLLVVNRDLPVAFEARKEMKLQREQLKICLEHELAEKRTLILDKTQTNHPEISPQEKIEGGESEHSPTDVFVQEDVSVSVNPEHRHHMGCIPSINSRPELVPVALDKDTVGQVIPILGDNSPVISQFNGNANIVEGLMGAKAKEIWHTVDGPQYNSSSDFSLLKPEPIEEHQAPIIDLERDHDVGESDDASLFSLYASQRINDHLTSFAKGSETPSPYAHHVHMNHLKQPDLQFLMANGSLLETVQFPHQFQHQQNILAHSHARENKSIFSNGIYPNQELYSSANGDLVERAQSNYWPGVEPSTSNSDGSLFSVLSGCRTMQPHSLNTTANSEYLIEARNFGTNNDDVYGYVPHQFKSSNSHEAAVSSTGLHVPWMNYHPQQNSNMQDSIGKPFLRSWNQ